MAKIIAKNKKQKNVFEEMLDDRVIRIEIVRQRHLLFFNFYFHNSIKYEIAPFQEEMFALTEDEKIKLAVIIAFRGSAKSTIITTSYVLWSILGIQQKKFVVILSRTEAKARQHLQNIKRELEENKLLQEDLGPFQEERNQWGAQALYIPKFNAKIMISSVEQSIRGFRHREHRPDLIILDDVEDTDSVRTQEGRDKAWEWLTKEVIPAGDRNTSMIAVGNLLHDDSILKRLQRKILNKEIDGVYLEYPIVDEENKPLWPGKFPTPKDIDNERRKVMSNTAWSVEYLLKIISEDEQVIKNEWIQYYDALPSELPKQTIIGTDLAISKESEADFTTTVPIRIYQNGENTKIYVLPNITNKRLSSLETLNHIKELAKIIGDPKIVIEKVGYQESTAEHLKYDGYNAEAFSLQGKDKKMRLQAVSHLFESRQIFFPKQGAEILVRQILGLGKEKHDDLVDALTIALLYFLQRYVKESGFYRLIKKGLDDMRKNPDQTQKPTGIYDWVKWSKN